ncbi:MAG: membrane protein insertase YidC [Elusimicrobiota bacterium]|nr:membrane protein insertase YidC [Elusimicrobiota bacterium]
MDKNLLLAVGLSIAVYGAWFGFIDPKLNPKPVKPAVAAATKAAAKTAAAPTAAPAPSLPAAATAAKAAAPAGEPLPQRLGEVAALVSPRGGALVSYKQPEPLGLVELVADAERGLFSTMPDLSFGRDPKLKDPAALAAERADGLKVVKQYLPGQGQVLSRLRVIASNPTRRPLEVGAWTLTVGPGLGTIATEKKENADVLRAIGLKPGSEGLRGSVETLKDGVYPTPYRWVAVDNRYFLAAVVPSWEHFEPARVEGKSALTLTAKPVTLPPGGTFTWELPYYLGPKGQTSLASYGIGLERAVDFGYFWQIGRPMLNALWWLNARLGNWGWAIVVLTLALQVLLFPLTWKSLKAAAAMKKLQPEMAKLQAKYKEDPQRLNQEMMGLYKKTGANPLGGCLPMLLQMPIFIALFNVLRNSWELHGAPWMFWVVDLSAKDPYYVLPVVMGGLMWLQSKLNPPSADPTQQQVMMFMPIIFTFMFLNFPSGLVLYWLTNSLVSTVLQVGLKDRLEA